MQFTFLFLFKQKVFLSFHFDYFVFKISYLILEEYLIFTQIKSHFQPHGAIDCIIRERKKKNMIFSLLLFLLSTLIFFQALAIISRAQICFFSFTFSNRDLGIMNYILSCVTLVTLRPYMWKGKYPFSVLAIIICTVMPPHLLWYCYVPDLYLQILWCDSTNSQLRNILNRLPVLQI